MAGSPEILGKELHDIIVVLHEQYVQRAAHSWGGRYQNKIAVQSGLAKSDSSLVNRDWRITRSPAETGETQSQLSMRSAAPSEREGE